MSPMQISPDVPTAALEERAIEQRRRIHNTVSELRDQVRETVREKFDVERYASEYASEYAWPVAGAAALFSLLIGYGSAGVVKSMFR